jgi:hypothetical protein
MGSMKGGAELAHAFVPALQWIRIHKGVWRRVVTQERESALRLFPCRTIAASTAIRSLSARRSDAAGALARKRQLPTAS